MVLLVMCSFTSAISFQNNTLVFPEATNTGQSASPPREAIKHTTDLRSGYSNFPILPLTEICVSPMIIIKLQQKNPMIKSRLQSEPEQTQSTHGHCPIRGA